MSDVFTKSKRSEVMSRIRSTGNRVTGPGNFNHENHERHEKGEEGGGSVSAGFLMFVLFVFFVVPTKCHDQSVACPTSSQNPNARK